VTVFTRQLASLLKSGVPILKSLATAGEQTENKAFSGIIEDIENITRDGKMISEALSKYPQLFPELYINMVRSGESAGVLDTILFRLADAREKEEESARKVQAALAYPALIVVVGIVTVFVLLPFFLPRVLELFKNYKHGRLPLPTRLLMHVSDFFSRDSYWIVLIAILLWAIYKRMTAIDKGRILVDGLKLRSPGLRERCRCCSIQVFPLIGRCLSAPAPCETLC
jgi:type II secretory pathway component PulF